MFVVFVCSVNYVLSNIFLDVKQFNMCVYIPSGGEVVEWLEALTHILEAPGSSPLSDH